MKAIILACAVVSCDEPPPVRSEAQIRANTAEVFAPVNINERAFLDHLALVVPGLDRDSLSLGPSHFSREHRTLRGRLAGYTVDPCEVQAEILWTDVLEARRWHAIEAMLVGRTGDWCE